MPSKRVNLNFYQLNPEKIENETAQIKAIKNIFTEMPPEMHRVRRGDFSVSLYGDIEKREGVYLATLVHTQLSNIPPSYDDSRDVIKPLPLADGVGLGYQTNFLFDPTVRIVMIESVKNGVTVGGLCALLNRNFDLPMLDASLVINPSDMEKLNKMGTIKKFQVKIAKMESGTVFKGGKKSLSQITASADNTNTDTLEYTITAGRRKGESLNVNKVLDWARGFFKYKDNKEVEKLVIVGKETDEDQSETIDLVKQRVKDFITIETQRLVGSFEASDRKGKLLEVYQMHRRGFEIYRLKKIE